MQRRIWMQAGVGTAVYCTAPFMAQATNRRCDLPAHHALATSIKHLPATQRFDLVLKNLPNQSIAADFGAGSWNGEPIGIPINYVGPTEPKTAVQFLYADESDREPYPIPANPLIEGGEKSTGDRHILMCSGSEQKLYELFDAHRLPGGGWKAGSGAVFDLRSYALRPLRFTSADAAGLPIAPLLVRYEDVARGEINHALRFTTPKTSRRFLWPARHFAAPTDAADLPPMGLRLRLKHDWPIARFPYQARVVLKALQDYGMVLADNGGAFFITGEPDARWNNRELQTLRTVPISAFEAVDTDPWIQHIDSARVRGT
jgi:hypothetical protein